MAGTDGSRPRPTYVVLLVLISLVTGAAAGWIAHPDSRVSRIVGTVEGVSQGAAPYASECQRRSRSVLRHHLPLALSFLQLEG